MATMSVHNALEAWQLGKISDGEACKLTGMQTRQDLYTLCRKSDVEITLLANMITLTPGTLSVDVSDDRSTLYVHALECSDADGIRRDIANGFERKIREAFG